MYIFHFQYLALSLTNDIFKGICCLLNRDDKSFGIIGRRGIKIHSLLPISVVTVAFMTLGPSLVLAMFHNIFDTVPERPVGNSDNLYFVLDGGSLIHRAVWPKQETFATDDADVHIVKTAIEIYEKIKKQVIVIGQDVDLLVLPTALTPDYIDILMLKEGKGKVKDRFYRSKDLQNSNLVIECKKSILFLHAISGWDTTSGFYGKEKLQAMQLFNHSKYLQDLQYP
ncbi:hypothetical protein AVEN_13553-1 [Araneus ventricosus]|uniref:Uncharacterized protein n=1 Tax=Araneus ventricosus TaxID=182803 RepID=A0A4Y2D5Q9_ARAVE|nr:hypothetical protein AVEN_13553-1 [Araneus ventricosus]